MSPAHRDVETASWLNTAVTGAWVALMVLLFVLGVLNALAGNWLVVALAFVVIVAMAVDEVRRRWG